MAEILCQLKKKGGGGVSTLEPSISEIAVITTGGIEYSSDGKTLISSGNTFTGTNLKLEYNTPSSGYYKLTALTAGKYRVIGVLYDGGIQTEIITASANQAIFKSRYSAYAPVSGYYACGIVYKIS